MYLDCIWRMRRIATAIALSLLAATSCAQKPLFPGRWDEWETRTAEQAGFDTARLDEAIAFAQGAASRESRDLEKVIGEAFANEPFNTIIGPTRPRGDASGMIIRGGFIVAEWGDTTRADMTFSVTKSYLSTLAGLALGDGLIENLSDPVAKYIQDGKFESDHNASITWMHLLQQTSDWSGELWDKPDWCDRPEGKDPEQWSRRELHAPGTHFKYNDVRVNLLAFCLTHVFRQPLPVVLRERIMDPIGASATWRWNGYENSWIELDGLKIQSVSGGGHWGGGMVISTRDHARFGYLFLRNGNWNGRQLLPEGWVDSIIEPAEANPEYGFMWWLNPGRQKFAEAPESCFYAAGFGGNYIFVDRENDLLIVLRWTPDLAGVVRHVYAALEPVEPSRR